MNMWAKEGEREKGREKEGLYWCAAFRRLMQLSIKWEGKEVEVKKIKGRLHHCELKK